MCRQRKRADGGKLLDGLDDVAAASSKKKDADIVLSMQGPSIWLSAEEEWSSSGRPNRLQAFCVRCGFWFAFRVLVCCLRCVDCLSSLFSQNSCGDISEASCKHSAELRVAIWMNHQGRQQVRAVLKRSRSSLDAAAFLENSVKLYRSPGLALIAPWPRSLSYTLRTYAQRRFSGFTLPCTAPDLRRPRFRRVVYYVHGGGFVSGDFAAYKAFMEKLGTVMRAEVFFPSYRLAPEHTIDEALADVSDGYAELSKGAFDEIIVVGESAGGALATLLVQRLVSLSSASTSAPVAKGACRPRVPDSLLLLSPVTDLSASGASFSENEATDCMVPSEFPRDVLYPAALGVSFPAASSRSTTSSAAARAAKSAATSQQQQQQQQQQRVCPFDASSPQVSPLFGSFEGFPPTHIIVARDEVLLDDSRRLAQRCRDAGVFVKEEIVPGAFHAFSLFWFAIPEAAASLESLRNFCDDRAFSPSSSSKALILNPQTRRAEEPPSSESTSCMDKESGNLASHCSSKCLSSGPPGGKLQKVAAAVGAAVRQREVAPKGGDRILASLPGERIRRGPRSIRRDMAEKGHAHGAAVSTGRAGCRVKGQ